MTNSAVSETHGTPQTLLPGCGIRVESISCANQLVHRSNHARCATMDGVDREQKARNNRTRSMRVALGILLLAAALLMSACSGLEVPGQAPGPLTPVPAVAHATPTITSGYIALLKEQAAITLPDGSMGLARLTGDNPTWSQDIPVPVGKADVPLYGLVLFITTGNDDLRGGSSGNADVTIHDATAGDVTYTNVNNNQRWNDGEWHAVFLVPTPPATTIGDVQGITIATHFGGGISGDNWDIAGVELDATYQYWP
jgi:hypothetical protein